MRAILFLMLVIVAVSNGNIPEQPKIYCGETPASILTCIGDPKIVNPAVAKKCSRPLSECDHVRCVFKESGWAKNNVINKKKITDSFDQFVKDNPDWSPAVQNVKSICLGDNLQVQGFDTNCPAFDIMHCVISSFIKFASPSQWASTETCKYPKQFASACPICPSSCFAPMVPTGSCNACVALPRTP